MTEDNAIPASDGDRILLVILARAIGSARAVRVNVLREVLREHERGLPPLRRIYCYQTASSDADDDASLREVLSLLDTVGFVSLNNGSVQLSALGNASSLLYSLPNEWRDVPAQLRERLSAPARAE